MNKHTYIRVLPLPPDTDKKLYYNHIAVLPGHVYRAVSLNTRNSVEILLDGRPVYLPERCYEWLSEDEATGTELS